LCVAFVVPVQERETTPAAGPVRRSMAMKLIAGLFFGVILAFFGWLIYGNVQGALTRAKWESARQQMLAEAPSGQRLPPLEATTSDAVIEEDIGGYFAQKSRMQNVLGDSGSPGFSAPTPSHVSHTLLYQREKEPPFSYGAVVVTVDQYPNSGTKSFGTAS
jgi:hypothetical protein